MSVLTGFACIIYLFIICCFAHSHRRNDHFKVKSKRLLKLERGEAPWWLECVILPTAREGGRGLRSVEMENKPTKIKGAVRICCYGDPAIQIVREFEHPPTVKKELRKCQVERLEKEVTNQKWQGSLVTIRLQDEALKAIVADRVEVLSNTQSLACLICANNCYQLDYVQVRRPIQVRRVRRCAVCVVRPQKV